MKTIDKIKIFLIKNKSKNIQILEYFFNYPQPMNKIEAQLYLHNMFNSEFNDYLNTLNKNIDVRSNIAMWIYKNFIFIENDSQPKYTLDWEPSAEKKLKTIIKNYLRRN